MFTEIIVAIYDTDEDAEHAVAEMLAANVPSSSIHRHTKADSPALAPRPSAEHEPGFWSRLFGGHSRDHAVYDRALHNGGNVVTVTDVPDHTMAHVMAILERHNPVDVDEQAASFTGIAHDPDPVVSGRDEPLEAPRYGDRLINQGGPRVRRFGVPSQAGTTP
jgi:hypothetical protein